MTEESSDRHPPADLRCQIYVTSGVPDMGLSRCGNEGTHWERWTGCGCADPDSEVCEDDFYSWECGSAHDPQIGEAA